MFSVDFFQLDDGTKPVAEFIKSLDVKLRALVANDLYKLQILGNEAKYPLSKPLGDGIFECRTKGEDRIARVLYFFDEGKIIIATNGFVKKTQKTPKSEIDLAKARRKIYFERKGKEA